MKVFRIIPEFRILRLTFDRQYAGNIKPYLNKNQERYHKNCCLLVAVVIGALSTERKLFIEFNQKKIIIQFDLIRYC